MEYQFLTILSNYRCCFNDYEASDNLTTYQINSLTKWFWNYNADSNKEK